VPVSIIARHVTGPECFVLLVGAPWRLKGVDLLIKAFLRLAPEFPHVGLKIIGNYPNPQPLRLLAKEAPQIEILPPKPNPEILGIMSRASVFVLPSRSEAMGRVILEAMAAGLPIIGSDVGGIPTLVRHGENGFLVPVEDIDALESRLRSLLADPELRRRMGNRSYELAHSVFSETAYVGHFANMVRATVGVQ
jgi:glycosyltransferase involved in cell wall biosynthesis